MVWLRNASQGGTNKYREFEARLLQTELDGSDGEHASRALDACQPYNEEEEPRRKRPDTRLRIVARVANAVYEARLVTGGEAASSAAEPSGGEPPTVIIRASAGHAVHESELESPAAATTTHGSAT